MTMSNTTLIESAPLSRRIHVLQIVGNSIVGGMESYVLRLVQHLPQERFQTTVLCPWESRYTERLRAAGADVLIAQMPDNDPAWGSISLAASLVKARGVDVIQCHLGNAHILAGLVSRLTGVPAVFTAHGLWIDSIDIEVHRLAGTHIAAVCQATYYHALNLGVKPDSVHLIPNGVDTDVFTPRREREGAMRRHLGLSPQTPLVGFIGRLSPEKGPETFLRSMMMLHQSLPEAHAVIAGDGPMRVQVGQFIERYRMEDYAHLAGVYEDIPGLLGELDLVVSASHSEGLPLALMEAMAAGVPVVATRVGGIPDLVQHEMSGLLCRDNDIEGIAAAARRLLLEPETARRFGDAARERALKHFPLSASVQSTGELLARLAWQRSSTRETPVQEPAANEAIATALMGKVSARSAVRSAKPVG
ncbi:MAG TPA: glycosyltransferase [Burkholderiaceae bacterium]|nr:glycosyltransferase [Burkholderiaceae bacterium]